MKPPWICGNYRECGRTYGLGEGLFIHISFVVVLVAWVAAQGVQFSGPIVAPNPAGWRGGRIFQLQGIDGFDFTNAHRSARCRHASRDDPSPASYDVAGRDLRYHGHDVHVVFGTHRGCV